MKYVMVLRGTAATDVLEAFFWYHAKNPALGDRFMGAFKESYDTIQDNPHGYQLRKGNFRHVVLSKFPYRVGYEIDGHEVFIYRVMHTSRKPSRKFGP